MGRGEAAQLLGAIAATIAVIFASLKKLPLIICIAIGCLVFGLFT